MNHSRKNGWQRVSSSHCTISKVSRKKDSDVGILVLGTLVGLFGLLAAFHATGMTTNAHAKLSGIVAKFVGQTEKVEKEEKVEAPFDRQRCLSASTYDPKRCKKYGSIQTRQNF